MRKKKISVLYYLNPKNVSAAIEQYGYTYHIRNTIFIYIFVAFLSVAGGFIFKLGAAEICIVAVCAMAMLPKAVVNSYKNMYEQKENIYIV